MIPITLEKSQTGRCYRILKRLVEFFIAKCSVRQFQAIFKFINHLICNLRLLNHFIPRNHFSESAQIDGLVLFIQNENESLTTSTPRRERLQITDNFLPFRDVIPTNVSSVGSMNILALLTKIPPSKYNCKINT